MRLVSGIFFTSLCVEACAAFLSPLQNIGRGRSEPALASVKRDADTKQEVVSSLDAQGLPFWWEAVWELDMMKAGNPGEEVQFSDIARVFK